MSEEPLADKFKAYKALQSLALKSLSCAQQLPADIEVVPKWTGIGFSLSGLFFVLPMSDVSEMLEVPAYTKIPGVKPWVNGIANVRGRLLPVFDLAAYFGNHLLENKKRQRLLVIDNEKVYAGLRVDQVFGMQYLPVDTRSDQFPEDLPENLKPFVNGRFDISSGHQWAVFNSSKLLEEPGFMDVVKL